MNRSPRKVEGQFRDSPITQDILKDGAEVMVVINMLFKKIV